MTRLKIIDNSEYTPLKQKNEDPSTDRINADRSGRDPDSDKQETNIFKIARVIAQRGYRYRVLRGASSIV